VLVPFEGGRIRSKGKRTPIITALHASAAAGGKRWTTVFQDRIRGPLTAAKVISTMNSGKTIGAFCKEGGSSSHRETYREEGGKKKLHPRQPGGKSLFRRTSERSASGEVLLSQVEIAERRFPS